MAEIEVDIYVHCEKEGCGYLPDTPECFNGDESDTFECECPECGTKDEFEIEFSPDICGFREKE